MGAVRTHNVLDVDFPSVGGEPQSAVIYDTVSDVMAGSGPDTSENVAYGVTKRVLTTPNPAYDVVQM